jgi:hypothetical protein
MPLEAPEETPETILENPAETIAENLEEIPTETLETMTTPENPKSTEEVIVEAHPTEAPKEAHPELTTDAAAEEDESAEGVQPVVEEASIEENCEDEDS